MGILGRLYRLLSAYITVTSERLERAASQVESESRRAADDLEEVLLRTTPRQEPARAAQPTAVDQSRLSAAYKVLGLPPGSDLKTVEEKWRSLVARADPKRFPAGSAEERRASEILKQVNEAYRELRDYLNPAGGRFEKLEI